MSAADWIMRAATHNAPPERREWAHAMRAEFEALDRGKLDWAIGCWSATTRWRMAMGGGYVLLLLAVLVLSQFHTIANGVFQWVLSSGITQFDFDRVATVTGIFPDLIEKALFCAIICAYRPDKAIMTTAAIVLAEQIFVGWVLATHPKIRASLVNLILHKTEPVRSYGAPLFVALFAEIGMCAVGCQLGIFIHRLMHRNR